VQLDLKAEINRAAAFSYLEFEFKYNGFESNNLEI
jgi:hypothetical protein